MIHRSTDSSRVRAVILCLSLAACGGSPGTTGGTPVPVASAPAPKPAVRAPDPIAPIEAAAYPATVATRRAALVDRGLRIGASDVGYYMDVQEARFRQLGGPALRLTRRGESVVLELPGPLNFEVGRAQLSEGARVALLGVARVLVDYRFTIISVDGHTDDSGDAAQNLALSAQRAAAVAKQLVAGGVEPARLVVVGRGSSQPVGDNTTEVGREANRRVVLRIEPLKR